MASVNKAILIGRLGKDPETRYLPNGDAVTNITLATSESWKDKNGEKQEKTEWHRVTFYRKLAEIAGQYLTKGGMVYVEGRIETKKWQDKDGQDRYTTEIVANEMRMLSGKQDGAAGQSAESGRTPSPQQESHKQTGGGFDDMSDDIPFANPYRGIRSMVV